ncbi:hypothetical protein B296_00000851 [Ensete ventricosum]|uniref:Uncharacterized protein n=1 Tax=Ensete ventricosum TaxID=4639 RepID=A0A427AN85_ENSVE|nr:hypothetical protein B296_00000851 [Ensete ventricosum]
MLAAIGHSFLCTGTQQPRLCFLHLLRTRASFALLLLPTRSSPSMHSSAASASCYRNAFVPLSLLSAPLAVVVTSSRALLIFFPLQPPQPQPPLVGPCCLLDPAAPTFSSSPDPVAHRNPLPLLVVSISTTIAPPL